MEDMYMSRSQPVFVYQPIDAFPTHLTLNRFLLVAFLNSERFASSSAAPNEEGIKIV